MKVKSTVFCGFLLMLSTVENLKAQKPILVTAEVKEASLYLNSAELNHQANVNLKKGQNEIIVKNLADYMDNNSIRIASNKPVTILSATFTNNIYSEYENEPNALVLKKVQDSIEWVNKEINVNSNKIATNNQTIQLLDKNQSVAGANSGLQLNDLSQVVDFYQKKRLELSNSIYDLGQKQIVLHITLKDLKNQLSIDTDKSEKTSKGKIVIQLMSDIDQTVQLQLSYITNLANWQPFYEIEAKGTEQAIKLISKAKVIQRTGLDWKQIKLSFSTAQPNPNNAIPYFGQWNLRFRPEARGRALDDARSVSPVNRGVSSFETRSAGAPPMEKASVTSAADYTQTTEQSLSVFYEVKIPYNIRSGNQAQTVTLAEQDMKANYNYYAAPKLNNDVYLIASLTDYAQYNLLKGEANIIFENRFVGKTYIDPSTTRDTFQIPLGVDKNIVVKRELVNEKSGNKILSNKRQSDFNYTISIRNNKSTSIRLVLKDQFPKSTDKEIEIELNKTSNATINEEVGTLTWELDIKPQKTQTVQFGYQVKFPKDKIIQNL
ncbi:MAG TPA: DUF4139 domain-containing protein [Edaphocola sp.]|nr:DUF4139 domain-containing protein [Edaphocola sp.]